MYWARPTPILPRSFVNVVCNRSRASSPATRTVPRWLTSNATASVRHAMCSASVPDGYARGIVQPPKSTSLAPSSRCSRVERRVARLAHEPGTRRRVLHAEPLDERGVVASVEDLHVHVGVALLEKPNLPVLARHELLPQRGQLEIDVELGQVEVGSERFEWPALRRLRTARTCAARSATRCRRSRGARRSGARSDGRSGLARARPGRQPPALNAS